MPAERQTFYNKRLADMERKRDNRESTHGTADVRVYDTHHVLTLRRSGSMKTGHNARDRREQAREARK
jgi:hypothetical protein